MVRWNKYKSFDPYRMWTIVSSWGEAICDGRTMWIYRNERPLAFFSPLGYMLYLDPPIEFQGLTGEQEWAAFRMLVFDKLEIRIPLDMIRFE